MCRAITAPKDRDMTRLRCDLGTCLDVAATVALTVSIVLLLVLIADLFVPPPYPDQLSAFANAALFLGLLSMPKICCTIAWPIHLHQKRRGERVFGWFRLVVLASAGWMWLVFEAITRL